MASAAALPTIPAGDTEQVARDLARVATTLAGIAATVGEQAASAVALVRHAADHARETANHAQDMLEVGMAIATALQEQQRRADTCYDIAARGHGAMAELADGAGDIESMSALIGSIAGESRLLALNARIEASRGGEAGRGFAVVADAMSTLSRQSLDTSRDIDQRVRAIAARIVSANTLFDAGRDQTAAVRKGLEDMEPAAQRQADAAGAIATLTADTAEMIENGAAMIGRLTSSATTVRLLADRIDAAATSLRQD